MIFLSYRIYLVPLAILGILIAIIFHECAHGLMAKWNGDNTAKYAGRITLNPVKHFDAIGFVMLLVVGFGYAKPVPVEVNNFRKKRKGIILTSLAGVLTNLMLGFFSLFFMVIIERFAHGSVIFRSAAQPGVIGGGHSLSGMFQSGGGVVFSSVAVGVVHFFFYIFARINFMLILFNMLPLFPLDGYRLVEATFGQNKKGVKFLRNYGPFILMVLVGITIVLSIVGAIIGINLAIYSPLTAMMHYGAGGFMQANANLFRVIFSRGAGSGFIRWIF